MCGCKCRGHSPEHWGLPPGQRSLGLAYLDLEFVLTLGFPESQGLEDSLKAFLCIAKEHLRILLEE